jgi:hypothetical protein
MSRTEGLVVIDQAKELGMVDVEISEVVFEEEEV